MESTVIETPVNDEKTKEILKEAAIYTQQILTVVNSIEQLSVDERLIFTHATAKLLDRHTAEAFETKDDFNKFKQKISFYFA